MPTGNDSPHTSPTRMSNSNSNLSSDASTTHSRKNSLDSTESSCGERKLSTASYDPTLYIQRARVTRPAPPKPSYDPLQFVQIKPCNLYQTAQQQLKKAEEVKKVKEIKKEEPEDWQSNLDNWKSSRRKRVEHIIDRVVEVKKLEIEEHDRTRRKSKTFSEMLEERSSRRGRLASLTVYTEDDDTHNDLNNSTTESDHQQIDENRSERSASLDDYDNQNILSENEDTDKWQKIDTNSTVNKEDSLSSLKSRCTDSLLSTSNNYEASSSLSKTYKQQQQSSSTLITNSVDDDDSCEYTYEGAIQDYKTRISRAQTNYNRNTLSSERENMSLSQTTDTINSTSAKPITTTNLHARRPSGTKIENHLANFETKSNDTNQSNLNTDSSLNSIPKKDLPKIDILKRRELFEKDQVNLSPTSTSSSTNSLISNQKKRLSGEFTSNTKSVKERLSSLEKNPSSQSSIDIQNSPRKISDDITSLKSRLQSLEKQTVPSAKTISDESSYIKRSQKIDVPVMPLKDRLSSLQNATTKEEIKKPVLLIDEQQLELMKKEEIEKQHLLRKEMLTSDDDNLSSSQEILNLQEESSNIDTDREDSGIHTTDVSCSVSQTDEQPDLVNEEPHHHHINTEDGLCQNIERPIHQHYKISTEKSDKPLTVLSTEKDVDICHTIVNEKSQSKLQKSSKHISESNQDNMTSGTLITTTTMATELAPVDQEPGIEEALELAFQAIDNENLNTKCNQSFLTSSNQISEENQKQLSHSRNEIIHNNDDDVDGITSVDNAKTLSQSDVNRSENQPLVDHQFQQNSPKSHKNVNNNNNESLPKTEIPIYENIEIYYNEFSINGIENIIENNGPVNCLPLEPPKEKPPPPPIDEDIENEDDKLHLQNNMMIRSNKNNENLSNKQKSTLITKHNSVDNQPKHHDNINKAKNMSTLSFENDEEFNNKEQNMQRMNSTKRIKKELRHKRSSFLGIEGNDEDVFLELTVAPPPDMAKLLEEERRLEKQFYMKAGLYDSSDTGDSRDSGVSENHSRQSSEPLTNSSEDNDDLLKQKEKEIIKVLENEEKKQKQASVASEKSENWIHQVHNISSTGNENDNAKIQCIEDQIREQEEVLRVERELLQLEQEELKRQRENLLLRENMARRELELGSKMLMSANYQSLQNINETSTTGIHNNHNNHYANLPNKIYQVNDDYRKSMSDLNEFNQLSKRIQPPPTPPAKPLRAYINVIDSKANSVDLTKISALKSSPSHKNLNHSEFSKSKSTSSEDFVPLRNYQPTSALQPHGNMSRHTLHALSATPKLKYTDGWVQQTIKNNKRTNSSESNISWLSHQQKRKSVPDGFNYSKHWLFQEAEQRRIEQQQKSLRATSQTTKITQTIQNGGTTDNKPLPDSVIQTLTQRLQSKGIGERSKKLEPLPLNDLLLTTVPTATSTARTGLNTLNPTLTSENQQEKVISVSGKKKCSHCGDELGRGAAMIIESLNSFYHMNCFKCCVCHIQLGDGVNGTDVRVRNHKLHCHNCYSSDDGIKFSCV